MTILNSNTLVSTTKRFHRGNPVAKEGCFPIYTDSDGKTTKVEINHLETIAKKYLGRKGVFPLIQSTSISDMNNLAKAILIEAGVKL